VVVRTMSEEIRVGGECVKRKEGAGAENTRGRDAS
jgi:hypothetical protein